MRPLGRLKRNFFDVLSLKSSRLCDPDNQMTATDKQSWASGVAGGHDKKEIPQVTLNHCSTEHQQRCVDDTRRDHTITFAMQVSIRWCVMRLRAHLTLVNQNTISSTLDRSVRTSLAEMQKFRSFVFGTRKKSRMWRPIKRDCFIIPPVASMCSVSALPISRNCLSEWRMT